MGRLKTECWRLAFEHYFKLLDKWRTIECFNIKDAQPALERKLRVAKEGRDLLNAISAADKAIALDEKGKTFTSPEFAEFLRAWDENERKKACFVIGGPLGLDNAVLEKCAMRISLSPMTLPHELARVLLLEQLFRAESILRNFPYHN